MKPIRLDQDVRSLSEFRAGMSSFVQQVTETRRPMLLTQNGRGVAVLLDVREFEEMRERTDVLLALIRGQDGILEGRVIPHEQVVAEIHEAIKKFELPEG